MHDGIAAAEGIASVERGGHPLAWVAAWMMSFPPAQVQTPVRVRFRADGGAEHWARTFGKHAFSSRQYEGAGKSERLLVERLGALEFAMALVLETDRLRLATRRWRVFGVAMPLWLAPRSSAHETAENGVFQFFVEISHPLCGLIVRYKGWLQSKPTKPGRESLAIAR